jgi:hypothetical protein
VNTVGDVVARLLKFDQSMPIIKSKDEEGNGFATIWCIQEEKFVDGDEYPASWEDIENGEYGDDPQVETKVVIWG